MGAPFAEVGEVATTARRLRQTCGGDAIPTFSVATAVPIRTRSGDDGGEQKALRNL